MHSYVVCCLHLFVFLVVKNVHSIREAMKQLSLKAASVSHPGRTELAKSALGRVGRIGTLFIIVSLVLLYLNTVRFFIHNTNTGTIIKLQDFCDALVPATSARAVEK